MNQARPLVFLVVEDDLGHAILLERTLRRGGLTNTITRFKDGEQVLSFLREGGRSAERCYLLLLDVNLPRMSGLEVLKELRVDVDPDLASLPALTLSTTERSEEEALARSLGCSTFLRKPVSFETILDALEALGLRDNLRGANGVFEAPLPSPETSPA